MSGAGNLAPHQDKIRNLVVEFNASLERLHAADGGITFTIVEAPGAAPALIARFQDDETRD